MREQIEKYFMQRKGLALAILLVCASILVFILPRNISTLCTSGKKIYWIIFLPSFGFLMYFFFGPKQKKEDSPLKGNSTVFLNYQSLQKKIAHCTYSLQKHHILWGYGSLILGWAVVLIGRWSQHPLYGHAIFALPVFILAFLASTKFVEEDNALDACIAESILKGIEFERTGEIRSFYFQNLANRYAGLNMWIFGFIRVFPILMILFSLFNAGPLSLLIDYLSQFFGSQILLFLSVHSSVGLLLGMIGMFYGKTACQPYRWLLWKLETINSVF